MKQFLENPPKWLKILFWTTVVLNAVLLGFYFTIAVTEMPCVATIYKEFMIWPQEWKMTNLWMMIPGYIIYNLDLPLAVLALFLSFIFLVKVTICIAIKKSCSTKKSILFYGAA